MKNIAHILLASVFLTLTACFSVNPDVEAEEDQEGYISLSREQFEAASMKIGSAQPSLFSTSVSCNGFIEASSRGTAEISTLLSGRVRQIYHVSGDRVNKGEVLFSLESSEIILLQQQYAEALQEMVLLESDFERLKSLSEENIVARKDYLKAESDFKSAQVKVAGLKSRLNMIHIDPSQVEKGVIVPYQSVLAPINGFITRQDLVLGQYIELNETPIEIIDPDKLRLRLQVFESSMQELSQGQEVLFSIPSFPERQFKGSLSQLGKAVSTENRTVLCYAKMNPVQDISFLDNMYVEAEIITCERQALALPETALIREADRDYVFILLEEDETHLIFRKIPVQTGPTRKGRTEILDENLGSLLVEGVFGLGGEE